MSKIVNCIRVAIVITVVTWPTVETYRLCVARRDAAEAQKLEQRVAAKFAALRQKDAPVTAQATPAKKP